MNEIRSLNVEGRLKFKIIFFIISNFFKVLPNKVITQLVLVSAVTAVLKGLPSRNHHSLSLLVLYSPGGDLDLMSMANHCTAQVKFVFISKQVFDLILKREFKQPPSDYEPHLPHLFLGTRISEISHGVLMRVSKRNRITHYVQFNFIYKSLLPIKRSCIEQDLPVIHLYKECFRTEGGKKIFSSVLKGCYRAEENEYFMVHNREIAKLLVSAGVCSPSQIEVTGQGRSDFLWHRKNNSTQKLKKTVTFFAISPKAGFPNFDLGNVEDIDSSMKSEMKTIDLSIYNSQIIESLIKMSRELDFRFVVKGKARFWPSAYDGGDVEFLSGPPDLDLILRSDIIIGCNSTCLVEGIIGDARIVSFKPSEVANNRFRAFFHDLADCADEVGSIEELCEAVSGYFRGEFKSAGEIVHISTKKMIIDRYLGNPDGFAGNRIFNSLCQIS
jgi:hypothetical protein